MAKVKAGISRLRAVLTTGSYAANKNLLELSTREKGIVTPSSVRPF